MVPHEISPLRVRSSSWAQKADWIMELSVTIRLQVTSNNKRQSWIIWNPMFLYSPNIQRQVFTVDLIRIQVSQSNERRRMKTRTLDMKRSHSRHMSFHVISCHFCVHFATHSDTSKACEEDEQSSDKETCSSAFKHILSSSDSAFSRPGV